MSLVTSSHITGLTVAGEGGSNTADLMAEVGMYTHRRARLSSLGSVVSTRDRLLPPSLGGKEGGGAGQRLVLVTTRVVYDARRIIFIFLNLLLL